MNTLQQSDYKITPTILNAFQYYLDSDYWALEYKKRRKVDDENFDEALYLAEFSKKCEQQLFNTINRVPFVITEAMARGKAFEHVVNMCLEHKSHRNKIEEACQQNSTIIAEYSDTDVNYGFGFGADIIAHIVEKLEISASTQQQVYCEGTIEINNNRAELYGYADYLLDFSIVDLKTTSMYEFPKYNKNWQRYIYPYCLTQAGNSIVSMQFIVTDFKNLYQEVYKHSQQEATEELQEILDRFIYWLNANKHRITDTKIFGGESPEKRKDNSRIKIRFNN